MYAYKGRLQHVPWEKWSVWRLCQIIAIYDVCEMFVSDYLVAKSLITQPITVIILIYKVSLFNGELKNGHVDAVLAVEENVRLNIFDET
jgi:hypothetical protein